MSFSLIRERTDLTEKHPVQQIGISSVTRCRCGQTWKIQMMRGKPGLPGCVRCSCDRELISWSGTVVFNASRVVVD